MQAGFSRCQAGFTRAKNMGNILMKNLMDFCIGASLYWLFDFGMHYYQNALRPPGIKGKM
jgi:Amt family ammonium transporter